MSDERTEQATPKRRQQAKEEGQLPKSQDFDGALMLSVGCALIYLLASFILEKMKVHAVFTFTHLDPLAIDKSTIWGYFSPSATLIMFILLPIFLTLLVVAIGIKRAQTGHLITFKPLKPDIKKLNPVSGAKKFFSIKSLVELLKSILKLVIVGGTAYAVVSLRIDEVRGLLGLDVSIALVTLSNIILQIMMYICIIYLILGIIDLIYQRYEHEKSIKMTKQDVKDERKNQDGSPEIKQKIKSIQMKFAQQRMMASVPEADVIITNPTHYSIAVRYDTSISPAPQVVAKGVDFVAFKIREIAKENDVPIIENKPLARTLYKIVPVDGMIPAELYVAIAEVLAYVYKTNGRKGN